MTEPSIRSRHNALVQRTRGAISSARERDEQGCFAIEGPRLAREALSSPLVLEQALLTPDACEEEGLRDVREALAARGVPVSRVEKALLDSLQDADAPRGIVLLARLPSPTALPEAADVSGRPMVACWGVQDPGNVGAIARVLEASGGDVLDLSAGCADAWHPRAVRGSAGSLFRLSVRRRLETGPMLAAYRERGILLVAAVAHGGTPLAEARLAGLPGSRSRFVLALGGEGSGLPPEVEAAAGVRVTIPMQGRVESLNVAVSAALVLFEAARQRVSAG